MTIVPRQQGANKILSAIEKDLESDLFVQSHLSNIFTPMMATRTDAHHHPAASATGGGTVVAAGQLLAYRSPSVRYDKGLHGALSPATTVHLALPHAAAVRTQGKPRLPLPASAKAMPRPLQPPQEQQQHQQQPQAMLQQKQRQNHSQQNATPLHPQARPRPRVISQPPPRSVASPAVIGLDLALIPPADHRDSAMSPRNSVAVKAPARPSLLAPVDIPRRVSVGSTQGHTLWKPVSAPTTSPISEGPPQPSVINPPPVVASAPAPAPAPVAPAPAIDTPKLSGPPSSSSVSINSSIGSAAPSIQAPASNHSSVSGHDNERAEIRARTLSSTNLAQRFSSEPPPQSRNVSPKITVEPLNNPVEKALPAAPMPEAVARPFPTPIQPTIMLPTDEIEYDEPPAPLRVINVTNDYAADSMATVPTTAEAPVPPAPAARSPSPVPDITVVPSTPPMSMKQLLGPNYPFPTTSSANNSRSSISPVPSPVLPEVTNHLPKHASLPPPARLHTQSNPALHTPRASMDVQGSTSYTAPSDRKPPPSTRGAPRFPPPGTRTWLPRKPTVPTPLSPTTALPQQVPPQAPLAFPTHSQKQQLQQQQQQHQQQPQSSRRVSATQKVAGSEPSRHQHAHTRSDPPPTPMRTHRPMPAPVRPFANNDIGYYSSDDDDPSKWAPYPDPEAIGSRRSSRSSRSSYSRNSRASGRNSIYGAHAESEEEDGGLLYAPPSISLPNLRPILQQGPGESELALGRKITFAVPYTESNKPSQAAGGRRRIRRRRQSTDSVIRGPEQIPWLQDSDIPRRGGLVTVPDPFGYSYADEGRYDVVNHPELIPADVYSRYVRSDGGPKLPEYRETFSAKSNAHRAAQEEESRARILGRKTRMPAVSVESEEEVPITVPVCLRRPRAMSESASGDDGAGHRKSGMGHNSGSKLRRRSRSRDRTADWAPPPTIPDPEPPTYYTMPPPSNSIFPSVMERMFSKLRR